MLGMVTDGMIAGMDKDGIIDGDGKKTVWLLVMVKDGLIVGNG